MALAAGLLGGGLLGGCADEAEPTTPPTATPPTATAAPLPLPQPVPPEGPVPPEPGLGPEDRALIVQARGVGAQWVVLLVAPAPNRTDEAAKELEELGGVLGTAGPGGGFLRLTMPTEGVERAAALPAVAALDVEQIIPPDSARPHG
ncbi:MAG: hypothetical protein ACRDTC_07605 [Pseudonocardiaceae bacterium]